MDDEYDLIVVGTSFAASFFLHGYLKGAKESARVLVLERGDRHTHAELNEIRWDIRRAGDETFSNRTPEKPWWYAPTFTIQNGFPSLYEDPRVELRLGANVQSLLMEGGDVRGVRYETKRGGRSARSIQVALGANAIFNPYILLRSGFEEHALGRYLHEQVGDTAYAYLEKGKGFGGSTSCTGLNFRLAHGPHRSERAAVMLETYSKPKIRIEKGRWRNILRVVGVFEDLPRASGRVTIDKKNDRPLTRFRGHSKYALRAVKSFEKDLARLLEGLPVERLEIGDVRKTEGHILGTARMGEDADSSVVDSFQRKHTHPNLFVLGGSSFPTGAVANPSLTIAALSLRSARAAHQP